MRPDGLPPQARRWSRSGSRPPRRNSITPRPARMLIGIRIFPDSFVSPICPDGGASESRTIGRALAD